MSSSDKPPAHASPQESRGGRGRGHQNRGGNRGGGRGGSRDGGRNRGGGGRGDSQGSSQGERQHQDHQQPQENRGQQGRANGGRGRAHDAGGRPANNRGQRRGDGNMGAESSVCKDNPPTQKSNDRRNTGRGGRSRNDSNRGRGGRGRGRDKSHHNNRSDDNDNSQRDQPHQLKDPPQGDAQHQQSQTTTRDIENGNGKNSNNNDSSNNNNKSRGQKRDNDSNKAEKTHPEDNRKSEASSTGKNKSDKNNSKKQSDSSNKSRNNKSTSENISSSESIPPSQPQTTNDLNYAKGEKITVLHIAEKPSIAQAVAKGLASAGDGGSKSQGRSLPVHEISNGVDFPKAPKASKCIHRITSVAGHVFSVDFPSQFQSWDSVDPAELFHAPIVKKPCKGSVVKHLQDEARGVNFIVLWLDCDREGENISFEVLDCCLHLMQGSGVAAYDRVYRAYFSAINPSDIKKAYNSLGKPDKNQSLSVDARQELDLKVGVAFSRFQTRFFQGRYGDLDSAVLSYGPCQTPTLGFCVQRHLEIETFKPEPYWTLDLAIVKSGKICRALWDSGRSFNQGKVVALVKACIEADPPCPARVTSVVTKDKKQGRPVPLNTVSLLKACSKALGIGPHAAMQTAERLYLSGYLSYPRTESTAYPNSFDIVGTLHQQSSDSRWGPYVRELLQTGSNKKSRGGVDMGDHPPITPCRSAGPGELVGDMGRVYDLVVRHFIASVSPDAVWRSTRVNIEIESIGDQGHFTIRGKQLVTPGFLAILLHKQYGDEGESTGFEKEDDDVDEEEKALPEFVEGEELSLTAAPSTGVTSSKLAIAPAASSSRATLEIKERMTTPPTHLTESELIGMMEKNGIGTDASISTHIENVLKRNYVELIPGRKMMPSKLGLVLAQGYHSIDSSLVLPQIRSDIEDQCSKIAKGLANKDDVIKRSIEIFENKFEYFVKNIGKMDLLFASSFTQLQDVGKPFTRCGLTRRYLQYVVGPPPRLYNKYTETVYPLPSGGEIKQWTGRKCLVPDCNFELCLYSVGQPPRTFPLCPYCFNNPRREWGPVPGEDPSNVEVPEDEVDKEDEAKERKQRRLGGRSLILECPHADGHPLIEDSTVSPDPDSDGVFILDPHLGPKWRLVGTRSPTIVHFPKEVDKIAVLDKTDEVLGCHLMQITFKEDSTPLEGGKTKYSCSFASDDLMQRMVRVHHGSERLKGSGRGGRGGGRGGRGGRGRGRGGRRG